MTTVKFCQRCPNCLLDTELECDFSDKEPDQTFQYRCDCCQCVWQVTVTIDGVTTSITEV